MTLPDRREPILATTDDRRAVFGRPLADMPADILASVRRDFLAFLRHLNVEHSPELGNHLRRELRQALVERRVTGTSYASLDLSFKPGDPRHLCGCIIGTVYIFQVLHYAPETRENLNDLVARAYRLGQTFGDGRAPLEMFALPISTWMPGVETESKLSFERRTQFLEWMDEYDTLTATN